MQKYLISIEKEGSSRLQNFFVQETFQMVKSDFVIKGVKGVELDTAEYFRLAVLGKKRALSPGELGCTLSHLAAYKDFLASNNELAIFFEDDAIQNQVYDLSELELKIKELNLSSGFLFSLGGIQLHYSRKVQGKFLQNKLFDQPILKIHPFFYKNLSSTYAYIIDRQMAEMLVEFHKIPQGCDHWEGLATLDPIPNLYATYLFEHPPIATESSHSYIEADRQDLLSKDRSRQSVFDKLKDSLLKKFLKFFLKTYR